MYKYCSASFDVKIISVANSSFLKLTKSPTIRSAIKLTSPLRTLTNWLRANKQTTDKPFSSESGDLPEWFVDDYWMERAYLYVCQWVCNAFICVLEKGLSVSRKGTAGVSKNNSHTETGSPRLILPNIVGPKRNTQIKKKLLDQFLKVSLFIGLRLSYLHSE